MEGKTSGPCRLARSRGDSSYQIRSGVESPRLGSAQRAVACRVGTICDRSRPCVLPRDRRGRGSIRYRREPDPDHRRSCHAGSDSGVDLWGFSSGYKWIWNASSCAGTYHAQSWIQPHHCGRHTISRSFLGCNVWIIGIVFLHTHGGNRATRRGSGGSMRNHARSRVPAVRSRSTVGNRRSASVTTGCSPPSGYWSNNVRDSVASRVRRDVDRRSAVWCYGGLGFGCDLGSLAKTKKVGHRQGWTAQSEVGDGALRAACLYSTSSRARPSNQRVTRPGRAENEHTRVDHRPRLGHPRWNHPNHQPLWSRWRSVDLCCTGNIHCIPFSGSLQTWHRA